MLKCAVVRRLWRISGLLKAVCRDKELRVGRFEKFTSEIRTHVEAGPRWTIKKEKTWVFILCFH